jgi:hypothetical protein
MDKNFDEIPILRIINNIADIFQKITIDLIDLFRSRALGKENIKFSGQYYNYLRHKNYSKCISLLIPFFGKLLIVKFKQEKNSDYSDSLRITQNILNHLKTHPPSNAIEYLVEQLNHFDNKEGETYSSYYELTTANFLAPYTYRHDQSKGGSIVKSCLLKSIYLGAYSHCLCLAPTGEYLDKKDPSGKVAYNVEVSQAADCESVYNIVATELKLELKKNPTQRPQKIMMGLMWAKGNVGHAALLVIEPSSEDLNAAHITMINTHGDSVSLFRDYEKRAVEAACSVYSSKQTLTTRNTQSLFATATSCSVDSIEITRSLVDQPNVYNFVKNKQLKIRSCAEDKIAREQHGEDVKKYIDSI